MRKPCATTIASKNADRAGIASGGGRGAECRQRAVVGLIAWANDS